ncbi:MAG: sel1 repeat family protein, partial [Synergistaceae bacterium]|nr:sel1 repeat family protein [Synergistaceae bacterium]
MKKLLIFTVMAAVIALLSASVSDAAQPSNETARLFEEGENFYNAQAYNSAFDRLSRAAGQGHTRAQVYVAYMYANGLGVSKDEAMAIEYWKMAARQGDAVAQNNLTSRGIRDWSGGSVQMPEIKATLPLEAVQKLFDEGETFYNAQAYNSAFERFYSAANQGHTKAQVYLAFMYANGLRVQKDEAKAIEYWKMAARKGDAVAQSNLASRGIRDWGSAPATAQTPPPRTPPPAQQISQPAATQTQAPAQQTSQPAAAQTPPRTPAGQATQPSDDAQKLFDEGEAFYNTQAYNSAF